MVFIRSRTWTHVPILFNYLHLSILTYTRAISTQHLVAIHVGTHKQLISGRQVSKYLVETGTYILCATYTIRSTGERVAFVFVMCFRYGDITDNEKTDS